VVVRSNDGSGILGVRLMMNVELGKISGQGARAISKCILWFEL